MHIRKISQTKAAMANSQAGLDIAMEVVGVLAAVIGVTVTIFTFGTGQNNVPAKKQAAAA